jgi:hypothetical protein
LGLAAKALHFGAGLPKATGVATSVEVENKLKTTH